MANILILGGTGFIGQNLVRALAENRNNQITIFDRAAHPSFSKLENATFIEGSFDQKTDFEKLLFGQEVVYHLISTSVPGTAASLSQEILNNVLPSTLLFEAAVKRKVGKLIFLSSGGTVYGDSDQAHLEEDLLAPINPYGVQKLMIEESLRYVTRGTGTDFRIVRLSNPYGPGQNPEGPVGLVTKLTYFVLKDQPIHIFGDGMNIRDYIFIDDVIRALIQITENGASRKTYNLGVGRGETIKDIIKTVEQVTGKEAKIISEPDRGIDVRKSILNVSALSQLLPVSDFLTLEEGIKITQQYLKDSLTQ